MEFVSWDDEIPNIWVLSILKNMKISWNDYLIPYGHGSIPINTIFSGMNIHLPAILMFTRGTRF